MVDNDKSSVRIVDVDMPFGSMVKFMVKWAIAAIPALIILMIIGALVGTLLGGVTAALLRKPLAGNSSSIESASLLDTANLGIATSPSANPSWTLAQSANPIDDSPTVVLSLDASSPASTMIRPSPSLVLRCKSNETDVYVSWNEFLGSDEISVTARLGKGAASRRTWRLSTDNSASFYPGNAPAFIKEIMAVDTLVLMTTPYNESPITATFEVKGLGEKVQPLRTACKW